MSFRKTKALLMGLVLIVSASGIVAAQQGADTNVENVAPEVDDVSKAGVQGQTLNPAVENTIQVQITDDNGLQDVEEVQMVFYRNTTTLGATDNLRDHYTLTYDANSDSVSVDPATGNGDGIDVSASVSDPLDDDEVTDTVNISFTPEEYAAPSANTGNDTVNDYFWVADTTVTDSASQTGLLSDTDWEMNRRLNYVADSDTITATGAPGDENVSYTPTLNFRNDGNVEADIRYTATNQTNESTEDLIPATNLAINDEDNTDTQVGYTESFQTLDANTDYNSADTVYNWVDIPVGIEQVSYSGTVTYNNEESAAS